MKGIIKKSFIFVVITTILCGLIYTLVMTGICQVLFNDKANGSIIEVNGVKYGSEFMAQQYEDDDHMWGRVMNLNMTTFKDKDGNTLLYSGPSNLTPASDDYEKTIQERVDKIKASHPEMGDTPIPVDLLTNSGSGLDPEISPEAAEYQVKRLAKNNDMTEEQVRNIIDKCTTGRFLGIFGEERVNVLEVNLMLDGILK